ncbi:uncharacterized protein Z520_06650 [Fonsecaea multimorphosa CBS 102226]|uniref:Cytidyltransferase-like domain-containing protein n=1 Tax=Fonsecaea multimorphosa CBS 102226 TaxID=1442371 RepID=A0A0D2JWH8_9EURO|nr:uncharacterized protein Z520_06650 [Fonsecaea multimorphosa CBS 102226]KIX97872.1 hypothetical protein Z520_06650 [Fonsecaea multimorphosa CBS 102226]OAL23639.1 hypothetical protein AYO22_06216 [Fonsecaea multimorphosa]
MAQGISLLLLPALAPSSPSSSFRSAYKITFESLLPKLVPADKESTSRVDIGLVLSSPSYPLSTNTSRATVFPLVQTLLKKTYSLICSVAAQKEIDLDFPGGIDARIFILEARLDELPENIVGKQCLSGPIIDLKTFALSDRSYTALYSVEGEAQEASLQQLIRIWNSKSNPPPLPPIHRLQSGPTIVHPEPSEATVEDGPLIIHRSVAVGGTFDHLHIGHKLLLTATILTAEPAQSSRPTEKDSRLITVGITGDELLVNKKYGSHVEHWDVRQQRTAQFIDSILAFYPRKSSSTNPTTTATNDSPSTTTEYIDEPGPNGKVVRVKYHFPSSSCPTTTIASDNNTADITINYTQISDPFGPTITDRDITALVISAETRSGGKAVNDKRTEKGWRALQVFEVDVLDAGVGLDDDEGGGGKEEQKKGFETKISSTEIRKRLQEREPATNQ